MIIDVNARYAKGKAKVRFGYYAYGKHISIELIDAEPNSFGERLCVATFNPDTDVTRYYPAFDFKDHVCIKTWSENDGIFESLVKAGVIEACLNADGVHALIPAGYTFGKVAKLTSAAHAEFIKQWETSR